MSCYNSDLSESSLDHRRREELPAIFMVKEVLLIVCMLLKVKDVQERLGIGRDRAYKLLNSKSFPTIKINKSLFVSEEALNEWSVDFFYDERRWCVRHSYSSRLSIKGLDEVFKIYGQG